MWTAHWVDSAQHIPLHWTKVNHEKFTTCILQFRSSCQSSNTQDFTYSIEIACCETAMSPNLSLMTIRKVIPIEDTLWNNFGPLHYFVSSHSGLLSLYFKLFYHDYIILHHLHFWDSKRAGCIMVITDITDIGRYTWTHNYKHTKLTMFHHDSQEFDNDFGTWPDKHLALSSLLGITDRFQGICQDIHAHHLNR